jgi:hypothetical protein
MKLFRLSILFVFGVTAALAENSARVGADDLPKPKADFAGKSELTKSYPYVGAWRGHHADSARVGIGTCVLIAPNWILTAAHVAHAEDSAPEKRRVDIRFPNADRHTVASFVGKGADIALVRLDKPVTNIVPVAILDHVLLETDGTVTFTVVGTSGGRHAYPGEQGFGKGVMITHPKVAGSQSGRAGDSGGAWVIERAGVDNDLLIGIIHGGASQGGKSFGLAVQPAAFHQWIDETLATTGDKARWQPLDEIPKNPTK